MHAGAGDGAQGAALHRARGLRADPFRGLVHRAAQSSGTALAPSSRRRPSHPLGVGIAPSRASAEHLASEKRAWSSCDGASKSMVHAVGRRMSAAALQGDAPTGRRAKELPVVSSRGLFQSAPEVKSSFGDLVIDCRAYRLGRPPGPAPIVLRTPPRIHD